MKRLILITIPFMMVSCSKKQETYFVQSVHDGDTFNINNIRYRLFGVDTPEISDQYNGFKPTEGIEHIYALEAKIFVERMILGKTVNASVVTTDRYKRQIAKISINNKDVGIELIKEGLARVAYISIDPKSPFYTPDYNYYHSLLDAQYDAYKNKKGVWRNISIYHDIFPKS